MIDNFKKGFFTVLDAYGLGGSVRESEKDGMLCLMVFLRTGEDEAPGVKRTVKNPKYHFPSFAEGKPEILPSPFHAGREYANGMIQELQRMVRRAFELLETESEKQVPRRGLIKNNKYAPIKAMTSKDRKEIHEYAIKRSDEIKRGE